MLRKQPLSIRYRAETSPDNEPISTGTNPVDVIAKRTIRSEDGGKREASNRKGMATLTTIVPSMQDQFGARMRRSRANTAFAAGMVTHGNGSYRTGR